MDTNLGQQDGSARLPQEQRVSRSELKKARIDSAIRRLRMIRLLIALGIIASIALVVGVSVWVARRSPHQIPGEVFASQGQEHVSLGNEFTYNSNPPTSGPHYAQPANWEMYDYEVNDGIFIHNMEHGGIWISYRPTISAQAMEDLKNMVNEFGGSQIVMAPRAANDTDIAIAAWTRLLKFDLTGDGLSDEQKDDIRAFYKALKNHGPEFVPGMGGIDPKTVQNAGQ